MKQLLKQDLKKSTTIILLSLIIILQLVVRFFVGANKEYYHMDEAYSYALMNYDKIQITENEDFYDTWHDKQYYIDYLSVNSNEVWNLLPVYEQQKNDVHPPLYYLLLRICATLTVDQFTKWTGLGLNMLIFIFSSIFIYLISNKILKNKKMALFTCLITGLTLGALDTTAYIRMYELANMFILILTYLHINIYEKKELETKDLLKIGITAILTSLTHYYTIIYMGVLFIIFVVKYIKEKQYKNLIKYIMTFAIAAITSLIIFPYSINHLFGGYRGEGAKNNLLNMNTFFQDMGICTYIFEKAISNNLIILLVIIYIIFNEIRKNKKIEMQDNKDLRLIFIPSVIYFILIAKMSPYKELRYFMPIISVSTIYMICVFYRLFTKILSSKIAKIVTVCIFGIMILFPIYSKDKIEFQYTKMNHLEQKMEEKSNIPALYIFNESNIRFLDDIDIFTKIENSYIMSYGKAIDENIENVLAQKDTSKGLIIVYNEGVEPKNIIENIMKKNGYTVQEQIQELNAGNVIFVY